MQVQIRCLFNRHLSVRIFKGRNEVCLAIIHLENTRDGLDSEAFFQLLKIQRRNETTLNHVYSFYEECQCKKIKKSNLNLWKDSFGILKKILTSQIDAEIIDELLKDVG